MQPNTGKTRPVEQVEGVTIRFVGDSGDGMQLVGSEFTKASAIAGNDLATFPDFPAEIRAPTGSLAGVSGYQVNFGSRDIFTPGDQPDVLVAMNPAALKTNLQDLRPGRHPHHQQRRLHRGQPREGRLQDPPARRRRPEEELQGRLGRHGQAHPGRAGRVGALQQGRGPLQELLRAGHDVLALQPPARAAAREHPGQVQEEAGDRRGQRQGVPGRSRLRRDHRALRLPVQGAGGQAGAGNLPERDRQRRRGPCAGHRGQAHRPRGLPGKLPHHPGHRDPPGLLLLQGHGGRDLPGRGRDRRHRLRHRRLLRRLPGRDHHLRPGARAQVGDAGARGHRRAAAGRHRRAARRPLHGHAHQDRAVRPLHRALRPPRRGAHAGHRGAQPGRLLLRDAGGVPDRHQVDDPGAACSPTGTLASAPSRSASPRRAR